MDLYPDANPKIPGLIGSLIDSQKRPSQENNNTNAVPTNSENVMVNGLSGARENESKENTPIPTIAPSPTLRLSNGVSNQ